MIFFPNEFSQLVIMICFLFSGYVVVVVILHIWIMLMSFVEIEMGFTTIDSTDGCNTQLKKKGNWKVTKNNDAINAWVDEVIN